MRNLWLLFLVGLASGFFSDKLLVSSQAPLTTADDLYLEGRSSGDLPIDDEDREDDGSGSGSGDYALSDLEIQKILNFSWTTNSKEMFPSHPEPTPGSPEPSTTTAAAAADSQDPSTTEDTDETLFNFPEEEATADVFSQSTPTNPPPSETTSGDVGVPKDEDEEDNSLERWDSVTPKHTEDEILIEKSDNEILHSAGKDSRLFNNDSPKGVPSTSLLENTQVLAVVIACGVVGFLCAVFLLLLLAYRMKKKDEGSYDLGDNKLSTTAYHKAPTKEFYA